MIVIQSSDKDNYLRALHRCDVEVGDNPSDGAHAGIEQVTPFVEYVEKQVEQALELGIRMGRGVLLTEGA
jgi:hypothetical protein